MSIDLDPQLLDQFAQHLRTLELKNTTIPLETLRIVFMEVFAHRPDTATRRNWMIEALRYAERLSIIRLPSDSGKRWDRTGEPHLPTQVTRIPEPCVPKIPWWKHQYWHPKLEWIEDLHDVSEGDRPFLLNVQQGFIAGWFETRVPLKYRSIQLTGQEKKLTDLLERKTLFGVGKLEVQDLNVSSDILPMAYQTVGEHPVAIVFENKSSYNLALQTLRIIGPRQSPYGIIAFGYGGGFVDSVRDFANIQTDTGIKLERIEYVGDLDWKGISIPQAAHTKAQQHGLPSVVPAKEIHQLMLIALLEPSINAANGFQGKPLKPNLVALEWLPATVRNEVQRILELGHRVPEEMLTEQSLLKLWSNQG
jgi:hypothetical protein